jgi:hypothetical protein
VTRDAAGASSDTASDSTTAEVKLVGVSSVGGRKGGGGELPADCTLKKRKGRNGSIPTGVSSPKGEALLPKKANLRSSSALPSASTVSTMIAIPTGSSWGSQPPSGATATP